MKLFQKQLVAITPTPVPTTVHSNRLWKIKWPCRRIRKAKTTIDPSHSRWYILQLSDTYRGLWLESTAIILSAIPQCQSFADESNLFRQTLEGTKSLRDHSGYSGGWCSAVIYITTAPVHPQH